MDDKLIDQPFPEDQQDLQHFKSFHNVEQAKEFTQLLDRKGIFYSVESTDVLIDQAIVGTGLLPKVVIKIKAADFKLVNQLIAAELATASPAELESHYLAQFEHKELYQILVEPD